MALEILIKHALRSIRGMFFNGGRMYKGILYGAGDSRQQCITLASIEGKF